MKVEFLNLIDQARSVKADVDASVQKVFETQNFILGKYVKLFEDWVAKDLKTRHAIACASGSDALYLALRALGIGPGDEVITTPFTFFATAGSISRAGATPVFSDIEENSFNLDPKKIDEAITPKTKAIILVHLFGLSCSMTEFQAIAKKRNLYLIEDMAQAYGATYLGEPVGGLSDIACLSFFPTKNLGGAGDGGMVVTSSDSLADKLSLLRVHGSKMKYYHELVGINSRLDEIQAAILLTKAAHIHDWNEKRAALAKVYDRELSGSPVQIPVNDKAKNRHIYHLYTIRSKDRDGLAEHLRINQIGCNIYYPVPLHLQPCFKDLGYQEGELPVAEKACREVLSLPMYPELPEDHVRFVCEQIRLFFKK